VSKLKDWADKQSPFIKLEDNESISGEYVGFAFVPNHFDAKKETAQYNLIVEGEEKVFQSGSANVAYQFDKIKEGGVVTITRHGEGPNTKYTVEGEITKKQAKEIEEEMAG
jgi:hypothetical protein